jgi:hypothetical protein
LTYKKTYGPNLEAKEQFLYIWDTFKDSRFEEKKLIWWKNANLFVTLLYINIIVLHSFASLIILLLNCFWLLENYLEDKLPSMVSNSLVLDCKYRHQVKVAKIGKCVGKVYTSKLKNTMAILSPDWRSLRIGAFTANVKIQHAICLYYVKFPSWLYQWHLRLLNEQ